MTDPNRGQEWKPLTQGQLELLRKATETFVAGMVYDRDQWRALVERLRHLVVGLLAEAREPLTRKEREVYDDRPFIMACEEVVAEARRRLEESK